MTLWHLNVFRLLDGHNELGRTTTCSIYKSKQTFLYYLTVRTNVTILMSLASLYDLSNSNSKYL